MDLGGTVACGCEPSKTKRLPRLALWVSTGAVVLLALAPSLLAKVSQPDHVARASSSTLSAIVHVEGMDCEACAAPMRRALSKLGGFQRLDLDLNKQTVTIAYEPGSDRPEAYVEAINRLGYEARLQAAPAGGAR
jgi:copper chaperone CopZ